MVSKPRMSAQIEREYQRQAISKSKVEKDTTCKSKDIYYGLFRLNPIEYQYVCL